MEQRSRSGLYRSGQRRAKQAARQAAQQSQQGSRDGTGGEAQDGAREDPRKGMETVPHVGHPQDGSQFQNIVEEQAWAEQRPSPEEEHRRPTPFDKAP